MHAVVDARLALREAHNLSAKDIAGITVGGDALLLARGDREVDNGRDAGVSIHHCAAVSLLHGRAGVTEFSDEQVRDPDVASLRAMTRVELLTELPPAAARVRIELRDGTRHETTVTGARGSESRLLEHAPDVRSVMRAACS